MTEEELANRAGVGAEEVRRLIDLGILLPPAEDRASTDGDVRRVRLAPACADGFRFRPVGEVALKGLARPIPLHEALLV